MPRPYERETWQIAEQIIGDTGAKFRVDRRPGGPEARHTCGIGYAAFFGTLRRMAQEEGCDAGMAGLRAAESKGRSLRVREYEQRRDSATGLPLLFPLADWRAGDVWAYIVSNEVPYHSVYDKYAPILAGYDSEQTRFVTFFDSEMERFGGPIIDGILSWRFREQSDR